MKLFAGLRAKSRAEKGRASEERAWIGRQYAAPSPSIIKRAVLLRNGIANGTWVETGTFEGDTAAMLARQARAVYTIEPDRALYEKAAARFKASPTVHALHGLSETVMPPLLETLAGDVSFWLDGHYSGGITHQGPTDCPVREELASIEKNLHRFANVRVMIDDVRCFDPSLPGFKDYPDVDYLVDWARRNKLAWHIEHDIFAAKNKP